MHALHVAIQANTGELIAQASTVLSTWEINYAGAKDSAGCGQSAQGMVFCIYAKYAQYMAIYTVVSTCKVIWTGNPARDGCAHAQLGGVSSLFACWVLFWHWLA